MKTKVFWIDQICINQEGEEKNGQVSMMGDIYRHAERVITYLGPAAADEDEEKRGVELLNRLHAHFTPNYDFIFRANGMSSAWFQYPNLPVVTLPEDLRDKANYNEANYAAFEWRWLLHVAYGEWTRRLWIVQEQCLNRDVVMLHGTTLLSWDAVATLPLLFSLELLPKPYANLYERRNLSGADLTLIEIDKSVYHIWHARKLQRQTQKAKPVHDLLLNMDLHQSLQCWDLRDRIYALLAISKDADILGIVPNYSAPPRQVFLEVSVRILQSSQHLRPLAYSVRWARITDESEKLSSMSASECISTLPSWALRPAPRPDPQIIVFNRCKPHPRLTINNRPSNFRLDQSILIVKGRGLDSITMPTPVVLTLPLSDLTIDTSHLIKYSRIMLHWRAVLLHLGMTSANVAGLCRVITGTPGWAPICRKGRSADESATFEFVSTCRRWVRIHNLHYLSVTSEVEALLKQCTSFVQELVKTFSDDEPRDDVFDANAPLTKEELDASNNLILLALTQGRSFCVTESGRVCNAMHEPKKGDLIAAFQGADRLFILRPVGERFRLVGEAYVDG